MLHRLSCFPFFFPYRIPGVDREKWQKQNEIHYIFQFLMQNIFIFFISGEDFFDQIEGVYRDRLRYKCQPSKVNTNFMGEFSVHDINRTNF